MNEHTKRTTIYLDDSLRHALQIKALETRHSMSYLINKAIQYSIAEDAADYESFNERKHEPSMTFESVLKTLKKRCLILFLKNIIVKKKKLL